MVAPRDAIAALACLPAVDAATLLTALTSVCLIDDRDGRYWTHDLFGSHAAELASAAELRMANDRLYTWYFDRVAAAARRLYPSMLRLDAAPDLSVEFDSDTSAMEWLTAEHADLAHDLYSAALPIAAAGSLVMEVDALLGLAQAALSRTNPAVADAYARRALAICTETGYGLAAEEAHRLLARDEVAISVSSAGTS